MILVCMYENTTLVPFTMLEIRLRVVLIKTKNLDKMLFLLQLLEVKAKL